MNESISKLTELLKPTIIDLDDGLNELSIKKNNLFEIGELIKEVGDDIKKIANYKNQNLIIDNLKNINTTEKEYKASCYLINSNDKNIQSLPQYIESSNYLERLINYFKKEYEELALDVSELEVVCNEKKLNKKYLEIFNLESPFVDDTDEFTEFLKEKELTNNDKINLLIYVIKNNIKGYLKEERVKGR